MNAKTLSPAQASDEITDAQLANVSGGARTAYVSEASVASLRPMKVSVTDMLNMTPQQLQQQSSQTAPQTTIRRY